MIYIAVLCNSTELLQNRSTILPLFIGPYATATVRRFSMKARYQVILLGEQKHIRCEQLAQGCWPNNAAAGLEPGTSRSQVRRPTITLPSHYRRNESINNNNNNNNNLYIGFLNFSSPSGSYVLRVKSKKIKNNNNKFIG